MTVRVAVVGALSQLQPLVEPQLGQAWHEPAGTICTPHCMQIGASLGRTLAGWQFEEALDLWVNRSAEDAEIVDETLLRLAPRHRGQVDWYWLAASHLSRSGVTVPRNWRSPVSGEPVANPNHNPDHNMMISLRS